MNADMEEQEDELLALQSIFDSEEFVREESKSAGKLRVFVELPADFTVALKEGEMLRQYDISFLSPLLLTFELPGDYPSCSPPSFTLTCSWLTSTQLSALGAQLTDLYQATGRAVVLFSWVQFLKEDALRFLDIQTLLQLPSDEHNTQQDSLNAALADPKNNQHTPKSEHIDSQSCDDSGSCKPDLSAPSLEVSQDPSTSDSQGAVALIQNTSNDSDHIAQASDGRKEAEQTLKSSSSSDPVDQSEQGAASLPVHPRESPQNKDKPPSGLSLTPSQTLLSQLLIYNAAQKQKVFATTVFDCAVCYTSWLGLDCVQLPECGHIFCQSCLAEFCKLQITEGNVRGVTCPEAACSATPTPAQVKRLVGEELFSRYDRLLLQATLDSMGDVVYCPRRSCGLAVIRDKFSTAALCSVCGFAFCVTCRKTYHGTDDCRTKKNASNEINEALQGNASLPQSQEGLKALWEDYNSGSKQRRRLLEKRYGRSVMQDTLQDWLSEDWKSLNSKNCPHCFCSIEKNHGCNMMTCSQCGQLFCWLCLARLGSGLAGRHFQDSSCSHFS